MHFLILHGLLVALRCFTGPFFGNSISLRWSITTPQPKWEIGFWFRKSSLSIFGLLLCETVPCLRVVLVWGIGSRVHFARNFITYITLTESYWTEFNGQSSVIVNWQHLMAYKISIYYHISTLLRPASVVHIGNRLKIGHCFMMSCMPKCSAHAVPIEDMG